MEGTQAAWSLLPMTLITSLNKWEALKISTPMSLPDFNPRLILWIGSESRFHGTGNEPRFTQLEWSPFGTGMQQRS